MTSMTPNRSRLPDRLTAALARVPWRLALIDGAVVVLWVLGVSIVFRTLEGPLWLYYVVAFGGVIVYSLASRR
jgi:hypothetical protein